MKRKIELLLASEQDNRSQEFGRGSHKAKASAMLFIRIADAFFLLYCKNNYSTLFTSIGIKSQRDTLKAVESALLRKVQETCTMTESVLPT